MSNDNPTQINVDESFLIDGELPESVVLELSNGETKEYQA